MALSPLIQAAVDLFHEASQFLHDVATGPASGPGSEVTNPADLTLQKTTRRTLVDAGLLTVFPGVPDDTYGTTNVFGIDSTTAILYERIATVWTVLTSPGFYTSHIFTTTPNDLVGENGDVGFVILDGVVDSIYKKETGAWVLKGEFNPQELIFSDNFDSTDGAVASATDVDTGQGWIAIPKAGTASVRPNADPNTIGGSLIETSGTVDDVVSLERRVSLINGGSPFTVAAAVLKGVRIVWEFKVDVVGEFYFGLQGHNNTSDEPERFIGLQYPASGNALAMTRSSIGVQATVDTGDVVDTDEHVCEIIVGNSQHTIILDGQSFPIAKTVTDSDTVGYGVWIRNTTGTAAKIQILSCKIYRDKY